jgi:hypothetical protein
VRRRVAEDEVGRLALADLEVGHRGERLAVQVDGAEPPVRSTTMLGPAMARSAGGRPDPVVEARDPRDGAP